MGFFMSIFARQKTIFCACVLLGLLSLTSCSSTQKMESRAKEQVLLVSVSEQKMLLLEGGREAARYLVSTAKNGLGDTPDSYKTPVGLMEVAEKIGDGLPLGSVLKDRQATGEVIEVGAPGRDPIVSRILWLRGLEESNRNAYARFIYIHGTPQESLLGTPASFGCIRMRSVDIMALYERIYPGAKILVSEESLEKAKLLWISAHPPA